MKSHYLLFMILSFYFQNINAQNSISSNKASALQHIEALYRKQENSNTFDNSDAQPYIKALYHSLKSKPNLTIKQRINFFSQAFLNQPYILFPLGEGLDSLYDQAPKYRVDGFDCQTYVDTVLALAISSNESIFKQCNHKIRYTNGIVSFHTRNHFTSIDWNISNQKQGFLKDITTTLKQPNGVPAAVESKTLINKASWYKHLPQSRIRLRNTTLEEQQQKLISLQKSGAHFQPQLSIIPYIPLTVLFDTKGQANTFLFNQIPQGVIIEIVRPNWDLTQIIGTHLDVSHLGFAIWKDKTLYFRQASSLEGKIIDVPLIDYLKKAMESPTIGGINIQSVIIENIVNQPMCKTNKSKIIHSEKRLN